MVDDIKGAYVATSHLIETGRNRLAICIGNPDLLISINRLKGFQEALRDHGIPFVKDYVISGESPEEAAAETAKLLDLETPPDGLFAISDLTMSGIMREVYQRKLKVPEQLALVGFCEDVFSLMYQPQLTTVLPMGFEIGRTAAERLFQHIADTSGLNRTPETILIESPLVIRQST
ncbi:MAG TPA: substrate-binding domain-containing protein [Bacteroidales bacterium]|nr:substrate-binding domain-containing protein [Bacteroidales bacterium]